MIYNDRDAKCKFGKEQHLRPKTQQNQENADTTSHLVPLFTGVSSVTVVLEVEWSELYQILENVAIANALQLEATRATPALSLFN